MNKLIFALAVIMLGVYGCAEEKPSDEQKKVTIETILEEYEECSEHAEDHKDCKCFTARAICEYNGITDLKKGGEYVDYHDIHGFLTSDDAWKNLGMATNQGALDNAQQMANDGYPVVAIKTDDQHKFAVLIIQGEQTKSNSWGLMVPNCAAFFPVSTRGLDSFINKGMNYAWSKPDAVQMWVKK